MVDDFPGDEGSSANGAKGRFDPMDLRKATRTDSLLPFLQEFVTTVALGGQQELEEFFGQETHS
jgi:hypothetical protein